MKHSGTTMSCGRYTAVRMVVALAAAIAALTLLTAPAAHAQYNPPADLTLNTTTAAPDGTFTIDACCFAPGSTVRIEFHSAPIILGTLIANDAGHVIGTFRVPTGATLGSHTIVAIGTGLGGDVVMVNSSLEVVAAGTVQAPAPAAAAPALPVTGSNSGMLATSAALLVVVGGLLVLASRRPRAATT